MNTRQKDDDGATKAPAAVAGSDWLGALIDLIGDLTSGHITEAAFHAAVRDLVRHNPGNPNPIAVWLQQMVAGKRLEAPLERTLRAALDQIPLSGGPGSGRTPNPPHVVDPDDERDLTVGSPRISGRATGASHRSPPLDLDEAPAPHVGMTLGGHFTLLEELGSGGMGRVFKAVDRWSVEAQDRNPYLAIKVLNEEFQRHPDANMALQREVKRAHAIAHQNVIDVYQFERDGPYSFMTMEYLEGQPLDKLLANDFAGGIPYERAWPIVKQICLALEHGHTKVYDDRKGIVHSDLKPGNVFICKDGSVKVLDFGISRAMPAIEHEKGHSDLTNFDPADRLGAMTMAYATFEMIQNERASPSDDIYALGCIVYELLSGHHPYRNVKGRKLSALDALGPPPMSPRRIESLDRRRWDALRKTLALKRESRTAAVSDFVRAFEPVSFVRHNALSILACGLLVVAGMVALGAHYYRDYIEQTVAPQELAHRQVKLTPAQSRQVADYLDHAQDYLGDADISLSADDLAYILSDGANNIDEILRAALKIDPSNVRALQMKANIADLYARKARQLIDANSLSTAMKLVFNGLKVKSGDRELVRLQREICARDNNACMGAL